MEEDSEEIGQEDIDIMVPVKEVIGNGYIKVKEQNIRKKDIRDSINEYSQHVQRKFWELMVIDFVPSKAVTHAERNSQRREKKKGDQLSNPIPIHYNVSPNRRTVGLDRSEISYNQSELKIDVQQYNLRGRYEIEKLLQQRLEPKEEANETKNGFRSNGQNIASTGHLISFPPIHSNRHANKSQLETYSSLAPSPKNKHEHLNFEMVPSIKIRRTSNKYRTDDRSLDENNVESVMKPRLSHHNTSRKDEPGASSMIRGGMMITPLVLMSQPVQVAYQSLAAIDAGTKSSSNLSKKKVSRTIQ
jgi:hypothetical protein